MTGVRGRLAAAAVISVAALSLASCSSSDSSATAVAASCQKVVGVLSNGPDPDADPVGYAEAQYHPLAALHLRDTTVNTDAHRLGRAFHAVFTSNGSAVSATALAKAEKVIDRVCPGATS